MVRVSCRMDQLIVGILVAACFLVLFAFSAQGDSLRISLAPVMGSVPIALADAWDLFAENGVDVDLIGLSDNHSRNLAMMANEIDGMVCDVTTAVLQASSGNNIVITSTAYMPAQTGSLALLTPSFYGIGSVNELFSTANSNDNSTPIGVIAMSDCEYYIDNLMQQLGYFGEPSDDYSYWNDMLQLATFLTMGSVYSAVLPEPYITCVANYPQVGHNGRTTMVNLSDFEGVELFPSLIIFRRQVIDENPEAVERFYAALRQSIDLINSSSEDELIDMGIEQALSLFFPGVGTGAVPQGILNDFNIPRFPLPAALSPDQFEKIATWASAKGYIRDQPDYDTMTTSRFLRQ